MVQQEMIPLFGRLQIVSVGVAETREVRMRKTPDHPTLGNNLFLSWLFTAVNLIIIE